MRIKRQKTKKIRYTTSFKSSYKACKRHVINFANKFQIALDLFFENPNLVNDHALTKRSLKDLRAFSVTEDIRVVYQKTKKYIILIRVGSHQEVYD